VGAPVGPQDHHRADQAAGHAGPAAGRDALAEKHRREDHRDPRLDEQQRDIVRQGQMGQPPEQEEDRAGDQRAKPQVVARRSTDVSPGRENGQQEACLEDEAEPNQAISPTDRVLDNHWAAVSATRMVNAATAIGIGP
jgi:hypothetical protein